MLRASWNISFVNCLMLLPSLNKDFTYLLNLYTILAFLIAFGFMSKKNSLKCMPCHPFTFSDEKFDQNGEKSLG